jgi:hypothetical protein
MHKCHVRVVIVGREFNETSLGKIASEAAAIEFVSEHYIIHAKTDVNSIARHERDMISMTIYLLLLHFPLYDFFVVAAH